MSAVVLVAVKVSVTVTRGAAVPRDRQPAVGGARAEARP
jgi:hypothetical protein